MKIRIEIEDKGLRSAHEHEFESKDIDAEILKERIINFLNAAGVFAECIEGARQPSYPIREKGGTLMGRLENFIRLELPNDWFTSQELREKFETMEDDIKLSTVSTYLSRMNRDGILERRGNKNYRQYRLSESQISEIAPLSIYPRKGVEQMLKAGWKDRF
jgi:DNA-binding transcriptional ArsR family regulator